MKTRLVMLVALILAVGAGVFYYKLTHDPGSSLVLGTGDGKPGFNRSAVPPAAPGITLLPIATGVTLNAPDSQPVDDLGILEMLFTNFRKSEGGNPTGENEEITAALLGKNPKHLAYLPAQGDFLNASGQLVDRWGTPYFFHSVAADRTGIRSAGPDRVMWTDDDVVLSP